MRLACLRFGLAFIGRLLPSAGAAAACFLRLAVLRFADLRLVVLRLAVLRLAVLRFADLRLVVLRLAVLRLVVLRFTDLRTVRFLAVDLRVVAFLRLLTAMGSPFWVTGKTSFFTTIPYYMGIHIQYQGN